MDASNWERMLIGSVLLDQTKIPYEVQPGDFGLQSHQLIWRHVMDLTTRGALSSKMLVETLRAAKVLDDVGGEDYIYDMVAGGDTAGVDEYARQVKDASAKRRLEEVCRETIIQARNGKSASEILQKHIQKIIKIQRSGARMARLVGDGIDDVVAKKEKIRSGEALLPWRPRTQAVYDLYGHTDESDFIIIVTTPGNGKSSYLRHEAIETALDGEGVLTITLENTREEAQDWAIAKISGTNYKKIKNPRLMSNKEWELYLETKEKVKSLPWYVEDVSFSNINDIIALARRMAVSHDNLKLIQIDGMYLIEENEQGKYEILSNVSQGLRSLAQELHIPIMATTQFSRKVNTHKTPEIGDLLYAGENPARSIWAFVKHNLTHAEAALFHENKDNEGRLLDEENYGVRVFRIKVLKNTGGETGWTGQIAWRKATNRFETLEPGWNRIVAPAQTQTYTQSTFKPAPKPAKEKK